MTSRDTDGKGPTPHEPWDMATTIEAPASGPASGPPITLPPHERLALSPPYEDQGEFARGGMGSIRAAWDRDLERNVAVKVISSQLCRDRGCVDRFIQEARVTAQLDHPNIVPVHALVAAHDGRPCLAMKRVEGRTLTQVLQELGPPPWPVVVFDEVLDTYLKVCDAVAFAHSRKVVHRDLKPDNVMVGAYGQVYVMDWGLALRLTDPPPAAAPVPLSERTTLEFLGTPSYMAPEQAQLHDREIDERTDVFLLGGILYEILTGRPPYRGYNVFATVCQAALGKVIPPDEVAPERAPPAGLARIAMKALSARPDDRHASVIELKRDVERFLRGEGRFPTQTFPAGAQILVEGAEGVAAYVIVSGRCVVYKGRGDARVVLREMGPGDSFGETSIFTGRPCTATVEALDEVRAKVVTPASLNEGIGLHTWLGSFVRSLAERFREVDARLRALEAKG